MYTIYNMPHFTTEESARSLVEACNGTLQFYWKGSITTANLAGVHFDNQKDLEVLSENLDYEPEIIW